jgi:hypothetical protein
LLRIKFFDRDPAVQRRVAVTAQEWTLHANLTFLFLPRESTAHAEIRISFAHDGAWSYLGTDALSVAQTQATMNFGWLTPASPDNEYSRVVPREFGHVLGLISEQMNPDVQIAWNKEVIYHELSGPPREARSMRCCSAASRNRRFPGIGSSIQPRS